MTVSDEGSVQTAASFSVPMKIDRILSSTSDRVNKMLWNVSSKW